MIYLAGVRVVPIGQQVGLEEARQQVIEAKHLDDEMGGTGKARAGAADLARVVPQWNAAHGHIRVFRLLHEGKGRFQRGGR